MFYIYKFVILSIEIQSSIISMIIIVVVVVVILIQVNLGQTCLQEPSNMRQKIIYKQNINNL